MIQIKILPNHKQAAYIAIGAANARIIKNHLLNLKKSKRLALLPWSVNLLPSKVHIIAAINKKIIEYINMSNILVNIIFHNPIQQSYKYNIAD